jgi:Bacterial sugar transferase
MKDVHRLPLSATPPTLGEHCYARTAGHYQTVLKCNGFLDLGSRLPHRSNKVTAISQGSPQPGLNLPQMRGARQSRTPRSIQRRRAAQQMRHSGEFLIALVLLLISAPLLLCIALAIKWDSPGPIFERRQRTRPDGRRFSMLSFRRNAYDPGQQRFRGETTRIGNFLKNTRMDALPQLFNVLRGEMSLAEMTLFD